MPVNFKSVRGVLNLNILLLAAVLTLFPVFIGVLSFRDSWAMVGRDMDQALAMEADFLNKWMTYHQNAVRSISRLSSVKARDFTRMDVDFSNFVKSNANFIAIVYVDAAGIVAFSSDRDGKGLSGVSVRDRPYYLEAQKGRESIADIIISKAIGKPVMIYSVPLMEGGAFSGLIFASIPFDAMLTALETTPFRNTGSFYLYRNGGSTLPADTPDVLQKIRSDAGNTVFYKNRGKYWIARGLPMAEHDLTLVIRMELWEFLAPYLKGFSLFAGISLLLLIASVLLSRTLYRRVDYSLSRLLAQVEKTGEGIFLGEPIHDIENAPVEIKMLGKALNEMSLSLKKKTEEIEYRSFHDILTGLYNRSFFEDAVKRLSTGRFDPVTVVVCDVDGLKLINDTFGHKVGDSLIIAAGEVLKKCFRKSDVIARIGGDEFAVLMPEDKGGEGCIQFPEKLACYLGEYRKTPDALPLNISWGTASGLASEDSLESLIHEADKRMYALKVAQRSDSRKDILGFLEEKIAAGRQGWAERHMAACAALMEIFAGTRPGLSPHMRNFLVRLAKNHDIGFSDIPRDILEKPGPLTDEEFEIIKEHPERGAYMASLFPELEDLQESILLHHRWWNGEGYPKGEGGEAIPVAARIMAVIDAYETMTADRSYNPPMAPRDAAEEIRRWAGTQFDPYWAEEFARFILEFHGEPEH